MARMRLHKNTRFGDNEVYPIYDIDFTNLSSTGYVQEESNDAVGSNAYKYRQWKTINNNIGLYIPRNIPKQETQEGNIIPFWHRFNNIVDGRYTLSQENLASFAAVEQGVRPDDWGTNPNYVELIRDSLSQPIYHDILYPYLNRTISTWSGSISYYEDTKRSELRMFYTDTGCSFSVAKTSYSRGDGHYIWPRTYAVGLYPHYQTSLRFPANYAYTDPEGHVIDDDYYINDTISVIDPSTGYADWSNYIDGYNCQMVFVHYVQDGTDFYGVAVIQMNNFTEQSEPVAIHVSAWDASFWGTSIIAGGGGSGPWTNDGPTSYVQGGQGTFQAPSDNRGSDPQDAHAIVEGYVGRYNSNISPLYGGYNKYIIDKTNWTPVQEFMGQLWDPNILNSWNNAKMNPLSAIVSCHFMPERLSPSPNGTTDQIKVLDRELSLHTANKYSNTIVHESIGEVDISSYFEGFPDYEATNIYVYLPYIGTYKLDTEAVMEGQLGIDYTADSFTGDCLAWIWTKDKFGNSQIRYTFKGNCAKPMYLASVVGAGAQRIGALLNMELEVGAQMASNEVSRYVESLNPHPSSPGRTPRTVAYNNFRNTMSSAVSGQAISSGIKNMINAGAQVSQNNASTGVISVPIDTQCYLIITRPQWSAPEEYGKQFGYPSDIGGTINQSDTEAGDPFTNFLSVRSIKLDGLSATDDEKSEIAILMKNGVYTTND